MIVDTSALIAIAMGEQHAERLLQTLRDDAAPRISAGNLMETYVVIEWRRHTQAAAVIAQVVMPIGLTVEPVTEAHVEIARDAYRRFGKGSGHPARLNFGDCFAYALARALNEPLLFVGNDFTHTDVRRVN